MAAENAQPFAARYPGPSESACRVRHRAAAESARDDRLLGQDCIRHTSKGEASQNTNATSDRHISVGRVLGMGWTRMWRFTLPGRAETQESGGNQPAVLTQLEGARKVWDRIGTTTFRRAVSSFRASERARAVGPPPLGRR